MLYCTVIYKAFSVNYASHRNETYNYMLEIMHVKKIYEIRFFIIEKHVNSKTLSNIVYT
jgi:hypothetical protein